jgi:hypothetical protein
MVYFCSTSARNFQLKGSFTLAKFYRKIACESDSRWSFPNYILCHGTNRTNTTSLIFGQDSIDETVLIDTMFRVFMVM